MTRFTLQPGRCYAAEFIFDGFGRPDFRSRSPIRVEAIRLVEGGSRRSELSFFHANYPAGVQQKTYVLQTIERTQEFILARRFDESAAMLVMLYEISWEWLRMHCGVAPSDSRDDVQEFLSTHHR